MTEIAISAKTLRDSRQTVVGWALALGALSYLVAQGALAPLDQQVAAWIAAIRSPALDGPMQALTWFGGPTWTALGLVGLSALAWRRGGRNAALLVSLAFVVGALLEVALRLWVSQWRPDTTGLPRSMALMSRFELAGFPSGHAFRSAFLFGWLANELRRHRAATWGGAGCVTMTVLVGLTRLYLNRHWASDVVGAWLVVLTTLAMARWWERR